MQTIAIAGLGTIGYAVARGIEEESARHEDLPDAMRLTAVAVRHPDASSARQRLQSLASRPAVVSLQDLAAHADIVIECGGASMLPLLAPAVLQAGKRLVVMSAGALLQAPKLLTLAHAHRGRILVPSGALGGLDAMAAMAQGEIRSVRLITRKPPAALGMSAEAGGAPVLLFAGPAIDAAIRFPANMNVAAALSLAGIGPQRTQVELWMDPAARGNHHAVEVVADSGVMRFSIDATPSANPGTSSLAAQSVLALLRRMTGVLQVG